MAPVATNDHLSESKNITLIAIVYEVMNAKWCAITTPYIPLTT